MNDKSYLTKFLLLSEIIWALVSCVSQPRKDQIKEGFLNPPDSSRPGVYWYFMDGNLDKRAMTADLESMKKAGIGYVLFLEVNVGVPRGKVDFLSEEWQVLYKHAVNESERLGIRVILGSGPGWAGSGGPWVSPQQSMIHLVSSDTTIAGPSDFNSPLSLPAPRKPFFGEGSLTPRLKELRNKWYKNVAFLAFPEPAAPSEIECTDEKALFYRAPYTSQPGVLPYIPSSASYDETPGSAIDRSKITDLSAMTDSIGIVHWKVPAGKWRIMRFVMRNNGAVTRPAPEPGLGFECDKFDTVAFDAHYNAYVGKLIKKVNPSGKSNMAGWTMIHIDSWEMGAQNWSPHFREEFIRRRGYDPLPLLPAYRGMSVGSREISKRFLWDIRQTSNELIVENHAGRFKELGRRYNLKLSIEPYDMNPSADLDLGGVADVPMCEFWSDGFGFNSSFSCIEATSIAHLSGLPVVAAEAFTAGSTEAWKKYPGNMKNQGDWAFCMGINRLIYYTFAHKPFPDRYRPGMTMGPYGVHWDRGQTWWTMVDAYHKYIARCQYILSQGNSVADILYLTPEGAPQVFLPPATALEGTSVMPDKRGFSFDGCSPAFLIRNADVKNGNIVFPGGASYKILVLPQVKTMTPALLVKIELLCHAGATIIGNPPEKSPSLVNYPQCDVQVKVLSENIWGTGALPDGLTLHRNGTGKIWYGNNLDWDNSYNSDGTDTLKLYPSYKLVEDLLRKDGVNADFAGSGNIRYTHRTLNNRDIYFISNRTDKPVTDSCIFRNGSINAELWNPVTGEINLIDCLKRKDGTAAVKISMEGYQSLFIVFCHDRIIRKKDGPDSVKFCKKETLYTLQGPWNLEFDTIWGGPRKILFETLEDWTKRSDEGIRHYSGIATYSKSFDLPDSTVLRSGTEYYLDLGTLYNIGRVRLNGADLGVVWTSPWQIKVSNILKKNDNHLEVDVANLWINRLIGDEAKPWDGVVDGKWPDWMHSETKRVSGRYTFTTHHYYKKDDQLSESGLLGPVKILKLNKLHQKTGSF